MNEFKSFELEKDFNVEHLFALIFGCSGSGKSFLTRDFLYRLKKQGYWKEFYLISPTERLSHSFKAFTDTHVMDEFDEGWIWDNIIEPRQERLRKRDLGIESNDEDESKMEDKDGGYLDLKHRGCTHNDGVNEVHTARLKKHSEIPTSYSMDMLMDYGGNGASTYSEAKKSREQRAIQLEMEQKKAEEEAEKARERKRPIKPVLIIIDDCAADPKLRKSQALNKLFISGRHLKIGVMILLQNINARDSVSPALRNNATLIVTARPRKQRDREYLVREWFSMGSEKEGEATLLELTEGDYNFVVVNLQKFARAKTLTDFIYRYKATEPPAFTLGRKRKRVVNKDQDHRYQGQDQGQDQGQVKNRDSFLQLTLIDQERNRQSEIGVNKYKEPLISFTPGKVLI